VLVDVQSDREGRDRHAEGLQGCNRQDAEDQRATGKGYGYLLTPADLRAICDSLNDERGTGGQTKLASLVGWHYSTLWRELHGLSRITHSEELAITSLRASGGQISCQAEA
jgi:hypothetical protein